MGPASVLVWEENGFTRVGYEAPDTIKGRYNVQGADQSFAEMAKALDKLTTAASE